MALLGIASLQLFYYYPQLPERVATQFDGQGHAQGWSSKREFLVLYCVMMAVLAFVSLVIPALLTRLPDSKINLPHKEYWLAPSRRAETIAFVEQRVIELGSASLILSISLLHLVIQVNLRGGDELPPFLFWLLLGGYLLFTAQWAIRFVRRFRRHR